MVPYSIYLTYKIYFLFYDIFWRDQDTIWPKRFGSDRIRPDPDPQHGEQGTGMSLLRKKSQMKKPWDP